MQNAAHDAEITVTDLACRRGERVLFSGLSWRAGPGAAVRIRGRNGAGKTSLLRLLAGFGWPDAGFVHREGAVAWVGHGDGLKSDLTPRENLEFHCALYDVPHTAVAPAIERLGLASVANLPCRVLSAGQRRRAALARLCLGSAKIWLLDEPLTALDADAQRVVESLVDDHGRGGGITVFTSHQPLASGLPVVEVELT
ncbi:MAG: heme ABC exporter ATP-binding protein CcmA [Gammaproteobacteria bacterium]